MNHLVYLTIIGILFSGCGEALGPNYKKPENLEKLDSKLITNSEINTTMIEWWKEYSNQDLNELIALAFKENKDLSILGKQLDLVLNQAEIARLSFMPTGSVQDTVSRSNNSGKAQTTNKLGVGLSTFEFDYLGKMQKTMEINDAFIVTAKENLALLYSTISFEIASAYSNVLYCDKRIETSNNKLEIFKKIEYIYQKRFDSGMDDISALLDIQSRIENERQSKNTTQMTKDNYLKTLKTLAGTQQDLNVTSKINPIGIPSQISSHQLENRFDIKLAEQNLIDKNARISIVKTLYYPSLSISAFAGISGSGGTAFSSTTPSWSATPTIMWNVFDMPKIGKLVKESEIQKEQALDNYIKTILNACIEVQSNYDVYEKNKTNFVYSQSYNKLLKNKLDILNEKFNIGTINKLQLLEAQASFLDAEDMLSININNLFQKEITLKKSIGGKVKDIKDTANKK